MPLGGPPSGRHGTINPISTHEQGSRRQLGSQGLLGGQVSGGDGLQLLVELRYGPPPSGLHPVPHGPWTDRHPTGPAQQRGRSGKRHKDRQSTAQVLEFTAGPLLGVQSQFVIQGSHLGCLAPLGTPSDPALPSERANEAEDLALRKAFTAHAGPTLWAAGPRRRTTGTFGQGRFDEVAGEDTRQGPGRQDQLWEGVGFFNRAEPALHAGIIIAYAVAEA